jgi:ADP-heptose:LPS heptosyltransferase
LAELICRQHPERCIDLTGKTSLSEMIEWLRRADLVISNDTGPMHVAAALQRPILAIYGPSDPLYTGPHQQSSGVLQAKHLPCVPCMKQTCSYEEPLACMRAITAEQVCSRALSMLEKSP